MIATDSGSVTISDSRRSFVQATASARAIFRAARNGVAQ
jgi:hypothetical protein